MKHRREILKEAQEKFPFDNTGRYSIRNNQEIDGLAIDQLKYVNRTTGKGFVLPTDWVEALTSLHKSWQQSPHFAFSNTNPQTPLEAVLNNNPSRYNIFDDFNAQIQRETNHRGLSHSAWDKLVDVAKITLEDVQNGLRVELRDEGKKVLETIDGLRSFSFDKKTGEFTMASRNTDFHGTEASYQNRGDRMR